jgi:hypothetical protein
MATTLEKYMPYDLGAGSNTTEDGWRSFMRRVLNTSGVFRDQLNKFQAFGDSTGMQVKVKSGQCWVEGHYGEQTTQVTLPVTAAHATLARKDRVILRNDFVNNKIELDVLTGTPNASPVTPVLTQSISKWEISLGVINVAAASVTITAGNVLDARHYLDAFPVFAYLNSDFTVLNNNTPQLVTDLQWPLSADAMYTVEGYLPFWANTAADARFQMTVPAGATGWWSGRNLDIGTGGFAGNFDGGSVPIGDVFGAGGASTGTYPAVAFSNTGLLGTLKTGEQSSPLQMMFSQSSANNTHASRLMAGAWIKCTRIRPVS